MFYKLQCNYQHWRHHKKAVKTPLQLLYQQTCIQPSRLFSASRFLVIDCEMSGLNPKKSQLLSIGWVMIEHGRIVNASARHLLIHADRGAGDSSRIHGLLDSNLAGAISPATALMLLAKQMPGAVLVFHHASLDMRFLQRASMESFRCPLLFSYVDTMMIEKQRIHLQGKSASLSLAKCRERYGLASGSQHNALADAQATAELLLAQASYLGKPDKLKLSQLSLQCSH